jgi:hypothetical protein
MPEPRRFKKGKHIYTKWGKAIKEVKTMPETDEQKKTVQMQVELDDATAQGVYANVAFITSNETEFVMDFIFAQPQQAKAKVRARVISSPVHTKKFLQALAAGVNKYEKQFGEIRVTAEADKKIGFGNA